MKVIKSIKNLLKTISNFLYPKTNDLGTTRSLKVSDLKTIHNGTENSHRYSAYAIVSSVAVGSAAFLFGLTYGLICPAVQPDSISAESSTSASSTITASSDSIISISAPTAVDLSVTPNFESSVFTTASATVTVSTNNAYGCTLSMGTSGTDSSGNASTALIHSNGTSTIPTLSVDTAATTFSSTSDTTTDNMWGYTLDNTTYSPLTTSTSPTVIKTTETTASADTTTVTFGTKITSSQPSGDYSNTVVFTTTATPDPDDEVPTDDLLFWGSANNPLNTATTLTDKSSNGNNGTLYNFDNTTSSGYNGTDLVFDGVDDYVNLGLAGYDFNNSNSYVAYVAVLSNDTDDEWKKIFSNQQLAGNSLETTPSNKFQMVGGYDSSIQNYRGVSSPNVLTLGEYYSIVGTMDGTDVKIYIDGSLVATNTTSELTTSVAPLLIGADPNAEGVAVGSFSNMALKEALIYDRALTESEVQTLTTGFQKKYQ